MAGCFKRFWHERRAAAAAEFALLALVLAGLLLGIIDFGRALWEYNSAIKACQAGVRIAVVNDIVASDLMTWNGTTDASPNLNAGDRVPVSEFPVPIVCDDSSCTPNLGYDGVAYAQIYDAMAAQYPRLGTAASPNAQAIVEVTYEHIGMGLAGNPVGPDVWPLTTVSLRGIQFGFSTPLIGAVLPFEFPRCSATLTGEDFQTCPDGTSKPPCS